MANLPIDSQFMLLSHHVGAYEDVVSYFLEEDEDGDEVQYDPHDHNGVWWLYRHRGISEYFNDRDECLQATIEYLKSRS